MAHDMFENYGKDVNPDKPKRYYCIAHKNEELAEFYASLYNPKHRYVITKGETKEIKIDITDFPEISAVEFKMEDPCGNYIPEYSYSIVEDPCYKYIDFVISSEETLKMTETDLIQNQIKFEVDILTTNGQLNVIKLDPIEVLASMCTGIILEVAVLSEDTKCGNNYVCGELLQQ